MLAREQALLKSSHLGMLAREQELLSREQKMLTREQKMLTRAQELLSREQALLKSSLQHPRCAYSSKYT